MGLSVQTLDEIFPYRRLLIYGNKGSGKTTLAAQAPNPAFLDYENSTEVLRDTEWEHIPVIGTHDELADPLNVIRFLQEPNEYDTIVIDSASTMNMSTLRHQMKEVASRRSNRNENLALFQEFRIQTNVFRGIWLELLKIEKNVIIICHEKYHYKYTAEGEKTSEVVAIRPDLPPEISEDVSKIVNEAIYLEVVPGLGNNPPKRYAYLNSNGKYFAKNRIRRSETKIENPTWKEIYAS